MSDSRRKFLKAGVLAALFAAVPLKDALGQSWKDRDGNPGNNPEPQNNQLANYTKATFISYLNSVFELHTTTGVVAITLLQVGDMPAPKGGECFSLLFRGGSRELQQDSYTLVHPSLGTFQLLLVPTGTDEYGAQGYLATINRLSYRDALANPAPAKSTTKGFGSTPPPATPAPANSPAITPAAPPATTPRARPKPVKKNRKPSWKSNDVEDFEDDGLI
ncbi:MAG: hypothetical protein QOG23_89 [Blastocatellia bacterium]|jgi:hypothetical protein|nr:hypothetical protein [Blastocatellia bacterium]